MKKKRVEQHFNASITVSKVFLDYLSNVISRKNPYRIFGRLLYFVQRSNDLLAQLPIR